MKHFQINSFDSIYNFLYKLYNKTHIFFDPAEDIGNLKDATGTSFFKPEEIKYLNEVLAECFIFCVLNDLNIYTVVTMVQYDLSQIKAAA